MAVWGYNSATAPIDDGFTVSTAPDDGIVTCSPGETESIVKFLTNSEVVVSVYNAGQRKGLATSTLNQLEERRFRAGAIGNAADSSVEYAEIRAKESDSTKAELVAQNFGKKAQIVLDDDAELSGPGVNVVIGDKFNKLKAGVPKRIKLAVPITVCR